ncbi:hypothetical protein RhiirC2_782771 [Rhizophagus irregularis]|uniref:Uncharacterized protein n=1 Tax=Rhizophagus irregularis TaxID=588596 RepID=A0A2N1N2B0_9GLOM|nr:hypothetical protein RhiirC2_782771 [Rhizophagus irregularis]
MATFINTYPNGPYTSDETKELEKCPLKCDVDTNYYHSPLLQRSPKRSCLDTLLALDSEQAGSSK